MDKCIEPEANNGIESEVGNGIESENSKEIELLKHDISVQLKAVSQKLHEKFPGPINDIPSLKILCDIFMFYFHESTDSYIKKEDLVSQNIAMIINDKMLKIIDSANILYSLSEPKFMKVVAQYNKTKILADHPLNTIEVIQKRTKIINNINLAKQADKS